MAPLARGLMFRKTREDLKDTIATGQQMYGTRRQLEREGRLLRFCQRRAALLRLSRKRQRRRELSGLVADPPLPRGTDPVRLADSDPQAAGRLRSAHGVPCQMKATCNPGGPGHHWVKAWVIDHGPYNVTHRRERPVEGLHPGDAAGQSGAAGQRSRPTSTSSGPRARRSWSGRGWRATGTSSRALLPGFSYAKHVVQPFVVPSRLDPLPQPRLGLGQTVLGRLVGGGAGRHAA